MEDSVPSNSINPRFTVQYDSMTDQKYTKSPFSPVSQCGNVARSKISGKSRRGQQKLSYPFWLNGFYAVPVLSDSSRKNGSSTWARPHLTRHWNLQYFWQFHHFGRTRAKRLEGLAPMDPPRLRARFQRQYEPEFPVSVCVAIINNLVFF